MLSVNDFSSYVSVSPEEISVNRHYLHFQPGMKVELMAIPPDGMSASSWGELYSKYAYDHRYSLVGKLLTIKELRGTPEGENVLFNEVPGFYIAKMFRLPGKMVAFPNGDVVKPAVEKYRFKIGDKVRLINAVGIPENLFPAFMSLRAELARRVGATREDNRSYTIDGVSDSGEISLSVMVGYYDPSLFTLVSRAAERTSPQPPPRESIEAGDYVTLKPTGYIPEVLMSQYELFVKAIGGTGLGRPYAVASSGSTSIAIYGIPARWHMNLFDIHTKSGSATDTFIKEWGPKQESVCPSGIATPTSNLSSMLSTMDNTTSKPLGASHPSWVGASGPVGFTGRAGVSGYEYPSISGNNSGSESIFQWPEFRKSSFKQGALVEIKTNKKNKIFNPIIL